MSGHKISTIKTGSGLKIVNITIPNYPVSTTSLWVNAGSTKDPIVRQGLAHFFEHILLTKTKKHPNRQKRLEVVEENGLFFNAFTTLQFQHYFYVHEPDSSDLALDLILDGLNDPIFDVELIEAEKKVILSEEEENSNDPASYIWRLANKGLWGEESLGKDFFGSAESIAAIKKEDFLSFFSDHFTLDNIVLVFINSNLTTTQQISEIESIKLSQKSPKIFTKQKHLTAYEAITFKKANINTLQLALTFATAPISEPKHNIIQELVGQYLSGGWTSKLIQRLRIEKKLTYWVYPDVSYLEYGGYIRFSLSINPKSIQEVLHVFETEIINLKKKEITDVDLFTLKTMGLVTFRA